MQSIKAAVCRAFGAPLVIEDILIAPPGMGEVEVALDAVAICHSDISFASGAWGGHLPAVYGHEAAGVISTVGKGVGDFNPGDPVVVTLIRACGSCPSCAGGKPTICETPHDTVKGPLRTADGGPLEQAMACGAFAEKVVVSHRQIVRIPETLPKDLASPLSCGVITGVGAAVNAAELRPGQDVVVIGAGGVGAIPAYDQAPRYLGRGGRAIPVMAPRWPRRWNRSRPSQTSGPGWPLSVADTAAGQRCSGRTNEFVNL